MEEVVFAFLILKTRKLGLEKPLNILWRWLGMSEEGGGGMAVEVELSH